MLPSYDAEVASDPLDAALARVGDRWTLLLIDALQAGPRRFGELADSVPGIAPNILSSRLKRLDEEGIVLSRRYQDRPPRLSYQLTEPGKELASALRLLAAWGARHSPEADAPRHDLCGTALEARWHCPTCDRTLEGDGSASELGYL
ncbi:MAG TPA: helix-turn-helix domain-containing protein [Acidimicrobiia bacterium]|nr:helix-turn-helix domain-containing protein [Acidimicrobiia bacterium]